MKIMLIHVHAGLPKKIEALVKQKQCELVAKWKKSIINHLYWCVVSTTDGNCDTIKAKLDNHIHNKHTRHGSRLFPKCVHRKVRPSKNACTWNKTKVVQKAWVYLPQCLHPLSLIMEWSAGENIHVHALYDFHDTLYIQSPTGYSSK